MKVFVSHSSTDKPFVSRLASDLRTKEGIDAWLDQWEINPGDRIPEKIEEGLKEAKVFLFVLSPDSVNSQWVEYERQSWITMQIEEEKKAKQEGRKPSVRLIPLIYRDCEIPVFLKAFCYIQITDRNYEEGFQRLVNAILGRSYKPPLKEETDMKVMADMSDKTDIQKSNPLSAGSLTGVPQRNYVMKLLKSLLPAQFEEVIFIYDIPGHILPTGVAQIQRIIPLVQYAEQKDGELSNLLEVIYEVALHLRR